jgi:2-iminobutanoate/2-iminopropanoate deaminase
MRPPIFRFAAARFGAAWLARFAAAGALLVPHPLAAADIQTIVPSNGAKPVGPYSPGLLAGDYLYVSGQGSTAKGKFEEHARSCLNNVKAIIEGAGLAMNQVVYAQLYLADIRNYEAVNKIWPEYFGELPARAALAVTRMPTDTPIEVTVVAYKGAREKVTLALPSPVPITPGILTADRFYLAGILGRDAENNTMPEKLEGQAAVLFERFERVIEAAKLTPRHFAFLNIYHTPQMPLEPITRRLARIYKGDRPAIAMVEVPALPFGANVSITGVAARNLADRQKDGACVSIGATRFCSLASGSTDLVDRQTRNTLRLLDLTNVVVSNVYLDSIDEFGEMNKSYAEAFAGKTLPTRTTVQPMKPGANGAKFRYSFVSVR